jgi:hypothetical protein
MRIAAATISSSAFRSGVNGFYVAKTRIAVAGPALARATCIKPAYFPGSKYFDPRNILWRRANSSSRRALAASIRRLIT